MHYRTRTPGEVTGLYTLAYRLLCEFLQSVRQQRWCFSNLETFVQKSMWTHLGLLLNLDDLDIQIEINFVPYDRGKMSCFNRSGKASRRYSTRMLVD
jgi:hypothetical protein